MSEEKVSWHSMDIQEVLKRLRTSTKGLSEEEARRRLLKYGPNVIEREKGKSPLIIFLEQFNNPLVILLLIATALSVFIGEIVDAITIIAIVIISSVLGFYQEFRAEKAVEALRKLVTPTARVLRNGEEKEIAASEIVPGDILLLSAGDRVPADARLIEVVNLKVDEAPLTGESVPVQKDIKKLPLDTALPDRRNMVYAGTVVTYGKGKAVVVATGMRTELGRIAASLQRVEKEETPLEKRMRKVGKVLALLCFIVATLVSLIGLLVWHYDPLTMVMWAISLAVAAVPEALPAIVTGTLAIGMYHMAKRRAIIRRLPAVETLGSTDFICSDKTGTMTKGEMTAKKIFLYNRIIDVTGSGYEPKGEFVVNGKRIDPLSINELKLLLLNCILNNDAVLEHKEGKWTIRGDTTEGALLVLARKAGLREERIRREYPRIGEIPFSSERKRMTTFHKTPDGNVIAFIKGAPEVVLKLSNSIVVNGEIEPLTREMREKIMKVVEEFASQGLRNLAFAYKISSIEEARIASEEIERNFVFLGIVGMIDPPRPEVKEALNLCKKAGIKVSMITGDHKLTAIAVARELGLYSDNDIVLTGTDLDRMSDHDLEKIVENVKVYARVSPEHKLRIVRALKKRKHIVAMTGDGVNDAPALKAADIGIAMGITGTEVAKEASDMILADDNFATIVEAVRKGREIFESIRKYLAYLLRCNITEIIIPLVASIMNLPLPFTAIQYLWINLITDGPPALALGVDPPDPDIMERPPRRLEDPIFDRRELLLFLIITPVLATLALITLFRTQLRFGVPVIEARTTLLLTMILTELMLSLSCRSLRHIVFKVGMFKNKYLIAAIVISVLAQIPILYVEPLQKAFGVVKPSMLDWMLSIIVAVMVFIIVELLKVLLKEEWFK